jgi:serine/threonine-protein kinase
MIDDPKALVGRVINGKYRIAALIGQGGMGAIYRAEQEPLGRVVALKTLLQTGAAKHDPQFQRRFFLEASLCAKLTHPNIVVIHDYGRMEGLGDAPEAYFIAMEFLEGETLAKRLKRRGGGLDLSETLWIGIEIARGLREAHRNGVIHRDLKPGNIMMVPDPETGERLKILDFGLVKQLEGEDGGEDLTQQGSFIGSPKYMSPEQVDGQAVDHRTDLYSLGVILYQCLAGRAPFESTQSMQILLGHVSGAVPPIREFNPEGRVPEEAEALIRRLLAKKPADRPATADELVKELRRLQEHCGFTPNLPTGQFSGTYPAVSGATPSGAPGSSAGNTSGSGPVPNPIRPETSGTTLAGASVQSRGESSSHVTPPAKRRGALIALGLAGIGGLALAVVLGMRLRGDSPAQPAAASGSAESRSGAAAAMARPPREGEPARGGAAEPSSGVGGATGAAVAGSTSQPRSADGAGAATAPTLAGTPGTTPVGASAPSAATATAPGTTAEPLQQAAGNEPAAGTHFGAHVPPGRRPPSVAHAGAGGTHPASMAAAPPVAPAATPPNVPAAPAAQEFGMLSLDTTPWSQVSLDGRPLGTTPLVRVRLPVGTHTLTLRNTDQNISVQYPITIRANETTTRRLGLE